MASLKQRPVCALMQDVTQQVRLVESSQKKAAVLELLQEAGLMDKGANMTGAPSTNRAVES